MRATKRWSEFAWWNLACWLTLGACFAAMITWAGKADAQVTAPAAGPQKAFRYDTTMLKNLSATMGLATGVSYGVSGADASQTLTVAAPGAGKFLHYRGCAVSYTGTAKGDVTVKFGANFVQIVSAGADDKALIQTGLDIRGPENTALTLLCAAGGGSDTSRAGLFYAVEDTTEIEP